MAMKTEGSVQACALNAVRVDGFVAGQTWLVFLDRFRQSVLAVMAEAAKLVARFRKFLALAELIMGIMTANANAVQ